MVREGLPVVTADPDLTQLFSLGILLAVCADIFSDISTGHGERRKAKRCSGWKSKQ